MNISQFRIFEPFVVNDECRVILSPPEKWREVEEWQDNWMLEVIGAGLDGKSVDAVNVLVQPDPFAEYDEKVIGDTGYVDITDVIRDLFALIDRTPLLTWWIPTRHPERVRERWPQVEMELRGAYTPDGSPQGPHGKTKITLPRRNVRLGLHYDASTGKDGVARSLEIEDLSDICGGCFVLRDDGEVEVLE